MRRLDSRARADTLARMRSRRAGWVVWALGPALGLAPGCFAHERDVDATLGTDGGGVAVDAATPREDAAIEPDAASPIDAGASDAFAPDDAASECGLLRADEWIAPRAVAAGGRAPVLMRTTQSGGCGCTPSARLEGPSGPGVSFLACACSNADPCVDPGYDATATADVTTAAGTQMQFYHPYPGGRVILEVVDPSVAQPVDTVDAIELVSPASGYLTGPERHVWVRLRGTASACCAVPLPLVTQGAGAMLTVTNAAPDPCGCVGSPMPWETFHDLGPLPAGHYVVSAGAMSAAIDVP